MFGFFAHESHETPSVSREIVGGGEVSSNSHGEKFILDACCSGRMMWFNKKHPNATYIDIRKESKGFSKHRPELRIGG